MSEVIKEEIERFFKEKSICILKEEISRLQAENEENIKRLRELAKEECELREGWHSQCEVIEVLREKNEELKKEIKELRKDYNYCKFHNYKQALEEIREMASVRFVRSGINVEADAYNYDMDKIYNKINEVLDENI